MNCCGIQRNAFATRDEMRGSPIITVPLSDRRENVVCPRPRRVGLLNDRHTRSLRSQLSHRDELCESNPGIDILDIILRQGCGSDEEQDCPEAITSSPPCRVANPLTQDSRFRDGLFVTPSPLPAALLPSSPSSGRTGSCVRASFGNNPAVRVVGFDCLDRDRHSIPALA